MHYLISGGTGFIGQALCRELLQRGDEVTVLTRSVPAAVRALSVGAQAVQDLDAIDAVDVVVNLAGENIAGGRWSPSRKRALLESRVQVTRRLCDWIAAAPRRPTAFVSASATGYYGPRGDEALAEDAAAGSDFGAGLCQAWEAEALKAQGLGVRTCRLRIGIVLGPGGGALASMLPAFRLGLGGPMGDGSQWMSWVHRSDLTALIRWLAQNDRARGIYNGTAPHPVRNGEFAETLARVLHRPAFLRTPAFLLKALFGEMSDLLLTGQNVLPQRALDEGFEFRFPTLEAALRDIVARP